MSRAKGMINLRALSIAKANLENAGAIMAAEIAAFLPGTWPIAEFSEVTPDGAFSNDPIIVSANAHPGETMQVPDWDDVGGSYDFAAAEAVKNAGLTGYLFAKRNLEYLAARFAFIPPDIFRPFGSRADRAFEGGKFPRDDWKPGSFDEEKWRVGRVGVANNVLHIINEIYRVAVENNEVHEHDWIITKLVDGVTIESGQPDSAFAAVLETLEDYVEDWQSVPAYARVAPLLGPNENTWNAAKYSLAAANALYDRWLSFLEKGAFAQDYFDQCITLWRTGSQTRRRDSYNQ